MMKATGIVRRIDYRVIIGTKVRSLENTGFFADFVQILRPKPNVERSDKILALLNMCRNNRRYFE